VAIAREIIFLFFKCEVLLNGGYSNCETLFDATAILVFIHYICS